MCTPNKAMDSLSQLPKHARALVDGRASIASFVVWIFISIVNCLQAWAQMLGTCTEFTFDFFAWLHCEFNAAFTTKIWCIVCTLVEGSSKRKARRRQESAENSFFVWHTTGAANSQTVNRVDAAIFLTFQPHASLVLCLSHPPFLPAVPALLKIPALQTKHMGTWKVHE